MKAYVGVGTPVDRSRCVAVDHGTESAYRRGCRCSDALSMRRNRDKRRRYGRYTPRIQPNVGTRRRLEALATMGWSSTALGERLSLAPSAINGNRTTPRVRADVAERVAAVYAELWDVPGPSSLTRSRAVARGWAPPAAWDDIDDPEERPSLGASDGNPVDDLAVGECAGGRLPLDRLNPTEQDAAMRIALGRYGHIPEHNLRAQEITRQLGCDNALYAIVRDRVRHAMQRERARQREAQDHEARAA